MVSLCGARAQMPIFSIPYSLPRLPTPDRMHVTPPVPRSFMVFVLVCLLLFFCGRGFLLWRFFISLFVLLITESFSLCYIFLNQFISDVDHSRWKIHLQTQTYVCQPSVQDKRPSRNSIDNWSFYELCYVRWSAIQQTREALGQQRRGSALSIRWLMMRE